MTHKDFLDKLINVWSKFPELRFGQLIAICMHGEDIDLFYIKNESLIENLEEFEKMYSTKQKEYGG